MAGRSSRQVTVAQGFTLIELLVVITIIGILMAILLPALRRARAEVDVIGCLNNLRTLAAAQTLYQADNKEFFTPSYSFLDGLNFYIGVPKEDFDSTKWTYGPLGWANVSRVYGTLCFPFKCPTRNRVANSSNPYLNTGSVVIGYSYASRPFGVSRADYGANSALHGGGIAGGYGYDFSLYTQALGTRFVGGDANAWRRTNEVKEPSRTLDMADGAGGNCPRMDYSSSVMSSPHRIGHDGTTTTTVMNYVDAHAKAWTIDEQYRQAGVFAQVDPGWVSSGKYCVWY